MGRIATSFRQRLAAAQALALSITCALGALSITGCGEARSTGDSLRSLRPGDRFPYKLVGDEQAGLWKVAAVASARAPRPLAAGQAPCEARAWVLRDTSGAPLAAGAVAVICGASPVPSGEGPFHAWTIRADLDTDQVALEPSFEDALRPDQDVLRVHERVTYRDRTIAIVERAIGLEGHRLRPILETICADPAAYAVNVSEPVVERQVGLIRKHYWSGFEGSHPKSFVCRSPRLMPDGAERPIEVRLAYDAGKGVYFYDPRR